MKSQRVKIYATLLCIIVFLLLTAIFISVMLIKVTSLRIALIIWGVFFLIAFIVILVFMALPAYGVRRLEQYNTESWEHKERLKLIELYNRHDFDSLIDVLKRYNKHQLKMMYYYIKSQVTTSQRAIEMQNVIPAMISNFVIPVTFLGMVFSYLITNDANGASLYTLLAPTLVTSGIAYIGVIITLTIFQIARRQTLQSHSGAYIYILEAIGGLQKSIEKPRVRKIR